MIKGEKYFSNDFATLFIKDVFFRPSCYKCKYKTIMHPSDITLGDFWEVDRVIPNFNDNKGVSLVLINSIKGKELFEGCRQNLIIRDAELGKSEQDIFYSPVSQPKSRIIYWKMFSCFGMEGILDYLHLKSTVGLWKKKIFKFSSR